MRMLIVTLCCFSILGMLTLGTSQPTSVQAANNNITKTTASVRDAAKDSNKEASELGDALGEHEDAVPGRLQDFLRSTNRLTALRDHLKEDLTAYDHAAASALSMFDKEASGINDPVVMKNMTLLRRKTQEDHAERQQSANETITLLDYVLAKGNDLAHAANCVMIANDLHTKGELVNEQTSDARRSAVTY